MPPTNGPSMKPRLMPAPMIPMPLARFFGVVVSATQAWLTENSPPARPPTKRDTNSVSES